MIFNINLTDPNDTTNTLFQQLEQHHEYYDEMKKQNLELETEVSQHQAKVNKVNCKDEPFTEQQSSHDNHQLKIIDRRSKAWKCREWKEPTIDNQSVV